MTDLDPFTDLLDYPMYVVTAEADGERAGCLVGFASQCSIQPARFMVWLSKTNRTYRWPERRTPHGASPAPRPGPAGPALRRRDRQPYRQVRRRPWHRGPGGQLILDEAPAWFVGRVENRVDGGDHVGFLLASEVAESVAGDRPPLLALGDTHDIARDTRRTERLTHAPASYHRSQTTAAAAPVAAARTSPGCRASAASAEWGWDVSSKSRVRRSRRPGPRPPAARGWSGGYRVRCRRSAATRSPSARGSRPAGRVPVCWRGSWRRWPPPRSTARGADGSPRSLRPSRPPPAGRWAGRAEGFSAAGTTPRRTAGC